MITGGSSGAESKNPWGWNCRDLKRASTKMSLLGALATSATVRARPPRSALRKRLSAEGPALPDVTRQRASVRLRKTWPCLGIYVTGRQQEREILNFSRLSPARSGGSPLPAVPPSALRRLRASRSGLSCCCSSALPLNPPKPTPFAKTEKHFPDASMCK